MSDPVPEQVTMGFTRPAHNKACARCRTRKIRCDSLWPACSSCSSADVQCLGFDTTLSKEVPRSVVAFLEGKVAALETRIKALKEQEQEQGGDHQAAVSVSHGISPSVRLRNKLTTALTSVMDFDGAESSNKFSYYSAFHLQQSSLPLPFPPKTRYPSRAEADGTGPAKAVNILEIPRNAADLMLKNYTGTLLARHPCVDEQELLDSYARCFDLPSEASSYDMFIVCMSLAISSASLIWRNEQHALSASEGFFAKAREMLTLSTTHDTEIRQIVVALLLTHYSFMNPTAVDAWYCIGDASRRCINLGLHREADPDMGLDMTELDTRRRLFWTACGLERTICSQLRLPFLLDESDITTQFYHPPPRNSVQGQNGAYANHTWQFRILETEVYSTLWTNKHHHTLVPLEDWLHSFNTRIDEWVSNAMEIELQQKALYGSENVFELSGLGRSLLKGRLHRPTPRVMYPSQESRLEYVKAAMAVADHYTKYCQQHQLIYPWFAAHTLFEIAVVTLDTAWLGSDWLPQYLDLQDVLNCINDFPRLLRQVASFWPAAKACADTVATLAKPVIGRLEAILCYLEPPARDEATSNILAWYLFPDSALAAEQRTVRTDFSEVEALGIMDLPMEGLENFDWTAMGPLNPAFFNLDFV